MKVKMRIFKPNKTKKIQIKVRVARPLNSEAKSNPKASKRSQEEIRKRKEKRIRIRGRKKKKKKKRKRKRNKRCKRRKINLKSDYSGISYLYFYELSLM
jgi:hypothetical protein